MGWYRSISAEANDGLLGVVGNEDNSERVRIAALNALDTLGAEELNEAVSIASASGLERLANAANRIRARSGSGDVLAKLKETIDSGSLSARQLAINTLAELDSKEADALVAQLLGQLIEGPFPTELAQDVIDLALNRGDAELKQSAEMFVNRDSSPTGPYRFTMVGGNVDIGRRIFNEREDVACLRCHKAEGLGGEVGPVLDGLASRVTPQHILEAIVMPNKEIAEGFENVMVETKDGVWYAGTIQTDTDEELVINSPEDGIITIEADNIKTRERGASGMPEGMGLILTRKELRDLMAYLTSLK